MKRIAIIGCGAMGSAIAEKIGIAHSLLLYDRFPSSAEKLAEKTGGSICRTIRETAESADLILLAIKPGQLPEFAEESKDCFRSDHILISMLAGISLARLRTCFPKSTLVRIMPNLAVLSGAGVIGIAEGGITSDLKDLLQAMFSSSGTVHFLPESQMNALTSLTGSGPAFMYVLIEAMVEAGISMGFSPTDARKLSVQMIRGSLALLDDSGKHPAELKWQIASPGGTTIEGMRTLEDKNIRSALIEAFLSAYSKAGAIEKGQSSLDKGI